MNSACQHCIAVSEASQVGEARRAAARVAELAGLDESQSGRVGIVVNELATNLHRHSTGGAILLQRLAVRGAMAVEVVAVDRGPGMHDTDRCLADGYSTNGTPGNGLGAVRRLSDVFDVYSQPGSGTVVVSRVFARPARPSKFEFGVVSLPYPGEVVCGDAWDVAESAEAVSFIVVDGLGHGLLASEAAAGAVNAFRAAPAASPTEIITSAHKSMSSTRGGAVAVASYDGGARLRYGAVGNIAGALVGDGKSRGLFSHNGTVGAQIRNIKEMEYDCAPGTLAILHSDGLTSRWNTGLYPGLTTRHPAVISAVLHRDFTRGRDDVTVLVARM